MVVPIGEIPGICEADGVIGEGTSMNNLELITAEDDTVQIELSMPVMGGTAIGDEINVVYNVMEDRNVSITATNLTTLQHLWSQNAADGREQCLEINSHGRATTYDMNVNYDRWAMSDGMLLLFESQKVGVEQTVPADTFQIMMLDADSLVLINGNYTTKFTRIN